MQYLISLPGIIGSVLLLSALLLFMKRFAYTMKTRDLYNRAINYRWLGWYGQISIMGTSSDWYKEYMRRFNRLTVAMWACILSALVVYLVGRYYVQQA